MRRKLTLISAPAGFGKTTLVSEWLADCERPVAWLSLDEGDNDPTRFLTYLVAALQTIASNIGAGVLAVLQAPQPPPTEVILTALLNEITTIPDHFILVLDDYHVIDSKPVDNALTFLLEHLPPQMHLVIATREDPHLPLARLRARGQLTELRAADLRFTPAEAAEFLNQVMGLNLSAEDIAALEARTEGWIAGLQLAALSMQGHQDVTSFIQSFTGSHHFVLDYLVEEVLQQQSESIQTFLLRTSILDRLCGSLCDAVLLDPLLPGRKRRSRDLGISRTRQPVHRPPGQRATLVSAITISLPMFCGNALDSGAALIYWERNQGCRCLAPARERVVRAQWFGGRCDPPCAGRRGFRSEPRTWSSWSCQHMNRSRQYATLLGWLKALPDELVRVRPVLSYWYALVSMSCGELGGVEPRLRDAERWLDTTATGERPDPGGDGRRRRRGISPSAGYDRPYPCRAGPGPGRYARDREKRSTGARSRT